MSATPPRPYLAIPYDWAFFKGIGHGFGVGTCLPRPPRSRAGAGVENNLRFPEEPPPPAPPARGDLRFTDPGWRHGGRESPVSGRAAALGPPNGFDHPTTILRPLPGSTDCPISSIKSYEKR